MTTIIVNFIIKLLVSLFSWGIKTGINTAKDKKIQEQTKEATDNKDVKKVNEIINNIK